MEKPTHHPIFSTQDVDNRQEPVTHRDHWQLFAIGLIFLALTYLLAALL